MEPINFYNSGNPKKYKAIGRWFCITSILMICVIISIASLHIHQWHQHSCLVQEKNAAHIELHKYDHIAAYHQNEKTMQTKLEKKAEHLQAHQKNSKNPVELLKAIKTALKQEATLESLSCKQQSIELKIAGEKTKTLVHCAETIGQKSAYADLAITALEAKDKNRIVATIKNS